MNREKCSVNQKKARNEKKILDIERARNLKQHRTEDTILPPHHHPAGRREPLGGSDMIDRL